MNYLRELNAFRDWSVINRPSTGQVALWHSLMSVNNMTGWVEWFTVPNQTLQLMTGLSRQGLDKARLQLNQKNLVEYRKGSSNQAGRYRMVSLVECQKVGTAVVTEVGTVGAFQLSQQERFGSTLFKQEETKQITDGDNQWRRLSDAYQEIFQTGMNSLQQQDLLHFMDEGMEVDLIIQDFKKAARNNAGFSYAFKVIKNQFEGGIRTLSECEVIDNQRKERRKTLELRTQASTGGVPNESSDTDAKLQANFYSRRRNGNV